MTERERWIVYPLLFLALGAALRDKLFDTTMSRRIVCQELVVVDEGQYPDQPTRLARIGAAETAAPGGPRIGRIEVNGRVDAEGYFVQGAPLGAAVRTVLPGISVQDLFRAWQRAAEQRQSEEAPGPQTPAPIEPGQTPEESAPGDTRSAATMPAHTTRDATSPPSASSSPDSTREVPPTPAE